MKLSINSEADGPLRLTGSLDIYGAEAARDALIAYVRDSVHPVVDLQAIEACDAAGVQVLCAAEKSAAQSGKRMKFARVSAAVASCWERLGYSIEVAS